MSFSKSKPKGLNKIPEAIGGNAKHKFNKIRDENEYDLVSSSIKKSNPYAKKLYAKPNV